MKKCRPALLVFLFVTALLFFASSALALESTCPPGLTAAASLARGETELSVYSDADKTARLGKLQKGDICRILGCSGAYYRIRFGEGEGYVLKSRLTVKGLTDGQPAPAVDTGLALEEYFYTAPSRAKTMGLRGTIQADAPLDTLFFFLWDERLQRVEHALVKEVKTPAAMLDIQDVCQQLEFPAMTAGRKTLLIQGASSGRVTELFRAPVYVCGSFKPVRNINDQCKFSAGRPQEELGGRSWTPTADRSTLTITLPQDGSAVLMTIEWRAPVESFSVVCLDAGQNIITEETRSTGFYADAVEFPPETRQVQLSACGENVMVRNLCVYDANHPDSAVQIWQPLPDKLDLMLISPHQDDELLFYGGAIPYACHISADVGVVYMTNCGRSRYAEAMDGLWTAGLRCHPIFMHWQDQWGSNANHALKTWSQNGVDPQREIVRLIRKYKPEVIIGPDPEGEYGHAQHKATSQLISAAVPLAMDAGYDPESAQEYGVWEVRKVYLHLYPENRITVDWNQPFSPGSPVSPIFLAKEAFDKHRSQQSFSMNRDALKYANSVFGLAYTAVGPDEAQNDLFEHIDLSH